MKATAAIAFVIAAGISLPVLAASDQGGYAGHGAMIEGRSFLLPVDFSMASFDAVDREALDAERLMQALSSTHSAFKLLVLDACRNNPLETRGATPLQRETDAPPPPRTENMLIAFSTTQGATALDGTGEHSPFAEGLIRHIGLADAAMNSAKPRGAAGGEIDE